MTKIDLGCGSRPREGYVGVDLSFAARVSVVADVGAALPFRNNSIDAVHLHHVIEHLVSIVTAMEEIWRVTRPGGTVEISAPHFSAQWLVWGDPTHRRGMSASTYRCFSPEADWYLSTARFRMTTCFLEKGDRSFAAVGWKFWYWPFVLWNKLCSFLVNRSVNSILRYERLFSKLVEFQEIKVVLTPIK